MIIFINCTYCEIESDSCNVWIRTTYFVSASLFFWIKGCFGCLGDESCILSRFCPTFQINWNNDIENSPKIVPLAMFLNKDWCTLIGSRRSTSAICFSNLEISSKIFQRTILNLIWDHSSITSWKRWVGWVRKRHFLMIYSTVNHQRGGLEGLKKSKMWWRNTWMVPI